MVQYGVTKTGFNVKPFQVILEEKAERARAMFGVDADLRSTSALRKLLDVSSFEDHELWKAMEQLYYSNFMSTASGDALNLLGEDIGVSRQFINATGEIQFKLTNEAPGRIYHLPEGTLVETDPPANPSKDPKRFRTLEAITLSSLKKEAWIKIEAVDRGPESNVAANAINKINSTYAQRYLNLRGATIAVKNTAPTAGGDQQENDVVYRDRLLGYPRTVWTLEAVRYVVKNIDGVRDCRLFDPLGGVDVSLSKFGVFSFGQRRFGTQRLYGTPYYFNILVAAYPGVLWESTQATAGLQKIIEQSIQAVRPISIFPNVRRANNVLIGLRVKVVVKSGHNGSAVIAAIKDALNRRINTLGLGSSVLYSEVLCDCMGVSGVVDVQQLHLRRSPPLFGGISFSDKQSFQQTVIEAEVGENLTLQPDEIAAFKIDANLIDIEVSDR